MDMRLEKRFQEISGTRLGGCETYRETTRLRAGREQPRVCDPSGRGQPERIDTPHSRPFFPSVLCRRSVVPSKSQPTYAHDPEREQKEPQQYPPRYAPGRRHIELAFHSNLTPSDGLSAIVRWDAFGSPRGCWRGLKNDGRGDPRPAAPGEGQNGRTPEGNTNGEVFSFAGDVKR